MIIPKPDTFAPEPAPACTNCGDRGFLLKPDGGHGTCTPCQCRDPRHSPLALRKHLAAAGLLPKEIRSAVEPWDKTTNVPPPWGLWIWLDSLPSGDPHPLTYGLMGPPGTGKTKGMARGAARYLKAGGTGLVWVSAPEIAKAIDRERKDWSIHGSPTDERCRGATLLCLDELGGESAEARQAHVIEDLLSYRDRAGLPTAWTSNAKTVASLGDGRIASRLGEGIVDRLEGDDYRSRRHSDSTQ